MTDFVFRTFTETWLHHRLQLTVQKPAERRSHPAGCSGAGPQDKLIDIGCGDGRFCVAAAQHAGVARAVGVEYDPQLIERCRERAAACGLSAMAAHFIEVLGATHGSCLRSWTP